MKKYLALALSTMFLIYGCGTTKSVLDGSTNNQGDVIIPQTAAVSRTDIILQIDTTPGVRDLLIAPTDYTAESNSLIEVYSAYPFTVSSFIATADASAAGTFIVDIGEDDARYSVLYITATAPGKVRSDAIVINK